MFSIYIYSTARSRGDDKDPVTDTNIPSHLELIAGHPDAGGVRERVWRDWAMHGVPAAPQDPRDHLHPGQGRLVFCRQQCPPGMKQQVLSFYTKLLGCIRQPVLPHINVHRPVLVRSQKFSCNM
uniref:Uncharacterized protein n=1 Tax=Oncorhynchus tshawytscha TaxID=74940 RepID=A0AAZ3S940_ONCTS